MMYVVKTSLYGWARKVMMAMSLFVLCCTMYWVAVEFSRPCAAWKIRGKRKKFVEAVRAWEERQGAKADEAEEKQVSESYANGTSDDAPGPTLSQDGCSKRSCSRCSPTESNFGLGNHVSLVRTQSEPLVQVPATSRRSSRLTTGEISTLPFTPTSPASCPTLSITTATKPDFTILHEVYESELYIQHCTAASPYQMSTSGKPLTFPVIARSILFPKKYRTIPFGKPAPPSWLHCQIYSYFAFLTCLFLSQAFIIYSHLQQAQLLDPLNGPFQTYATITYNNPTSPRSQYFGNSDRKTIPPWPSVSLTSTLLLTSPSTPKKIWLGWYYALLDLMIHVIVILQLELTLRWNRVSGLSGLWTSVGQLIPFIIGVGGLSLVLGRWTVRAWAKRAKRKGEKSGWDIDGGENDGDEEEEGRSEGRSEGLERGMGGGKRCIWHRRTGSRRSRARHNEDCIILILVHIFCINQQTVKKLGPRDTHVESVEIEQSNAGTAPQTAQQGILALDYCTAPRSET
jgi:hypothetical protein